MCFMIPDGYSLSCVSFLIVRGVVKVQRIVRGGMKAISNKKKPLMIHPLLLLCHYLAGGLRKEPIGEWKKDLFEWGAASSRLCDDIEVVNPSQHIMFPYKLLLPLSLILGIKVGGLPLVWGRFYFLPGSSLPSGKGNAL